MAVVQISKIQVRRGQKNSNTGVPQLSSAEFAWAVDTQELFIGNGSVAEGAPFVGNTKILTENDNIIQLASSYQFASTDPGITSSISRSLGDKIDEIEVSVLDFGADGDGSTDNVAAFESALTQLFANADTTFRKVLRIPNGEYLFSSDLNIPSNAVIEGETKNGVVLNLGANNILFTTTAGDQIASFTSSTRPENIVIKNLTIERTTGQTVLSGVKNALLEDVKFLGNYVLGDTVSSIANEPGALFWQNELVGIKVNDITIRNCEFMNNSLAVKCLQTAAFETHVTFNDCYFHTCDTGIFVNGVVDQTTRWEILDTEFNELAQQAFYSTQGVGTKIERSSFINVGNGTATAALPEVAQVIFGQSKDNAVIDCRTNRIEEAVLTDDDTTAAVAEVTNAGSVSFANRIDTNIFLSDGFRTLAALSADQSFYEIDYTLRLGTEKRSGRLRLMINDSKTEVTLADHSNYSSTSASSAAGQLMVNFVFQAVIDDNDADSGNDTIILSYKNPLASGSTGSIALGIAYGA